ncbi:MAG: hypothetical protein GX335_04970 [Firmicutes bacterium]|nr:hypothetical protein [Bacillota bacterium]
MSYRDYLEAQKKYIRTKKEARLLREERRRNPGPQRLDPPPAGPNKLVVTAGIFLTLFSLAALFYLGLPPQAQKTEPRGLTLGICGSELEFEEIRRWLEPEILSNNLSWTLQRFPAKEDLWQAFIRKEPIDLLIIEEELARDIYQREILVPLWQKKEAASFQNSFLSFWDPQPFRKTLGWAIPAQGNIEAARHLFTVINQFAQPFNCEQPRPP